MKKIIKIIGIFAIIMAFVSPAALAADEKIGFVDLSRLFDEYHKTKEYDKVLEEKHKTFEGERQVKVDKIQESIGKLGLLADDKKATLEQEIENMKAEVLEFDRQKKTDLTKERNEKIQEILLEIEKVVSDYAEKEKFSVILNDRVLIYGNQTSDLTEVILKILNKK